MKQSIFYLALALSVAAVVATKALAGGGTVDRTAIDRVGVDRTSSETARESRTVDRTLDAAGAKRLVVRVPLGAIRLSTVRGSRLVIHAVRSCALPLSGTGKRWLEDSVFTVTRVGADLNVEDRPFGANDFKDFDHTDRDREMSPRFDLQISAPEGVEVKLDMKIGSAKGEGRFAAIDGSIGAGALGFSRLDCLGTLHLRTGAGTIDAALNSPLVAASRLESGAGEVNVDLPRGSNLDLRADVGIGHIQGLPEVIGGQKTLKLGMDRSAQVGAGGTRLELHAGVGNIHVALRDNASFKPSSATSASRASEVDADSDLPDVIDRTAQTARIADSADAFDDADFAQIDKKELDETIRKAIATAQIEAKEAMAQAEKEVKAAMADLDRQMADRKKRRTDLKGLGIDDQALSKTIGEAVRAALETAKAATDAALRAAKEAGSENPRPSNGGE